MKVLVAAFYTNEFYRLKSLNLAKSIERVGIRSYTIEQVHGCKTWSDAVCRKVSWIRDTMNYLEDEDGLFYVDADAQFMRKPDWEIMKDCDFAAVEWKRHANCDTEVLTGSMFFRNSDRVRGFVDEWGKLTPKYRHTSTPEQRSLAEYLSKPNPLAVKKLPLGWCRIFDDMKAMVSDEETIIQHYQASREYKAIEAEEARKAKRTV